MSRIRLVYVAGPYSATNAYAVQHNINKAWEMGCHVADLGAFPVIPHTNTMHMDGIQPYKFWAEGTMQLMTHCDAVLILDGYIDSRGTKAEIKEAERLKIPIFYNLEDLELWLDEQYLPGFKND